MKGIPRSITGSEIDRSATDIVIVFHCDHCGHIWEPLVELFCHCNLETVDPTVWHAEYRTIADVLREVFPPCVAVL